MITKYLKSLLVLVIFLSSISFAGINSISWDTYDTLVLAPGEMMSFMTGGTNSNPGDGAGVRVISVTVNLPPGTYIRYEGTTPINVNEVICANQDCSNANDGADAMFSVPVRLVVDCETPEGDYYVSYSLTGKNMNCYPVVGCTESSTTTVSGPSTRISVRGETCSEQSTRTQAEGALSTASSAISQANSAKSSAQSYVDSAGSSCTQAQTSYSNGQSDISTANTYYSQADNYYDSGDYSGAKSKAESATSLANSAKNYFNSAKTYAQNCISEEQNAEENADTSIARATSSKNSAQTNVSKAGTRCTEAQTNWNNGVTKLDEAIDQYSDERYTEAKNNADSAKLFFDNAKTAAQNCIIEYGEARSSADTAISSANDKISEATGLITQAESKLNNSRSIRCANLNEAEQKLNSAKTNLNSALESMRSTNTSYNSGEYSSAEISANTAKQLGTTAISDANSSISIANVAVGNANQSARELESAEAAVSKVISFKNLAASINVTNTEADTLINSANQYLANAQIACRNSEYSLVQSNSNSANNSASQAYGMLENSMNQRIDQTLDELETRINDIKNVSTNYPIQYDTSDMEDDLHEIQLLRQGEDYSEVVLHMNALAGKVEDTELVITSQIDEIEQANRDREQSQLMTYLLIAGGIVIVFVGGWYLLRNISISVKRKGKKTKK